MKIGGFVPTTMLDYPGRLACTVFTQGCNMRCPWCQNGGLVLPQYFDPSLDPEEVLARIKKRRTILEGVCISGGEPTLQADLPDFIKKIKELGLCVKLDSNGCRPQVLSSLIKEGLIDMIAMDIKASPEYYAKSCGLREMDLAPYRESVELIMHSGIAYEFRTTLVKGIHNEEMLRAISAWIAGAKAYFLQSYTENERVISILEDNTPGQYTSFSPEEQKLLLAAAQTQVPSAALRYNP